MTAKEVSHLSTATFTTSRGLTYHYIHLAAPRTRNNTNKGNILILHGFPSIPTDFHSQITYLHSLGYSIIAPYLLGYYPTSTPTDPDTYRLKLICQDLTDLLDSLHITEPIHAIGHDWGATLLSRLEYYHSSRLAKVAYLSIAPVPFGQDFDLDKVNEMTKQMTGQAMFGYQKFFMDNFDNGRAAQLIAEKHDRMEMLMFAEDSERLWKQYFCAMSGLEKWLLGDEQAVMFEGVSEMMLEQRRVTFKSREEHTLSNGSVPGYTGSLNWYASHNRNLNVTDEQTERADWQAYRTDKHVLLVLGENDPPAPSDMHIGMAKAYVNDVEKQLTVHTIDAGHFLMIQQADKLNSVLQEFLEG